MCSNILTECKRISLVHEGEQLDISSILITALLDTREAMINIPFQWNINKVESPSLPSSGFGHQDLETHAELQRDLSRLAGVFCLFVFGEVKYIFALK